MFKYPQDLDALRAVVTEAWVMDRTQPWDSTHEFWEETQSWPPVPLAARPPGRPGETAQCGAPGGT